MNALKTSTVFFAIACLLVMSHPSTLIGKGSVGRFQPIEIPIPHSQLGITNVWDDVTVAGLLKAPNGSAVNVNGFYHSQNLWMVRFAPDQIGIWKYQLSLSDKNGVIQIIDSFECTQSNEQGFIRLHPSNPKQWIYSGTGNLFTSVGFGDCMGEKRDSILADGNLLDGGFRPKGYHEGIEWILPYSQYLISYGDAAGFNLYRYSDANCAYGMVKQISASGNVYDSLHTLWTDTLFTALRQHGFRIYMTILNGYVGSSSDQASIAAVERYAQYCIDRYGSLVDFWELTNESTPDSLWISKVATYIHDHDPYHHLVSVSWERPSHPAIDIISPHWYGRESVYTSDQTTADQINQYRQINKPVIFGEQGEGGWDSLSAMRMRGRIWSSIFNESILVFWNSTFAKDCPCNQYLGWEERRYTKVLMNFAKLLDSGVRRMTPASINGGYKVWGLRSSKLQALYIRNDNNVYAKDNLPSVQVDVPVEGEAIWYDVHTGDILQRQSVKAGAHILIPPAFQTDIAFIGGAITAPDTDSLFRIDINPRTEVLLNTPINTPQTFSLQITNTGKNPIILIKNWVYAPAKILSVTVNTPFPMTLSPSGSRTITVGYTMSDTGAAALVLSFLQSASPSWENVAISATGVLKSDVKKPNIEDQDVQVFPDPVKNLLNIEWSATYTDDITIQIYNLQGLKILQQTAKNTRQITLDLSKIPNGVYQLIGTKANEILFTKKVVVAH